MIIGQKITFSSIFLYDLTVLLTLITMKPLKDEKDGLTIAISYNCLRNY